MSTAEQETVELEEVIIMNFPLDLEKYYAVYGEVPTVLISLAIMLFTAFLLTRITKLAKLPNVTAYILTGVILGPFVLGAVPSNMIKGMAFISDIALAFIAFSVGRYFSIDAIKKTGGKVIIITLLESLMAGVVVTLLCKAIFFNSLSWSFAILLGAIATATAPASTMMTIKQYKAKGRFVDILLQVVSLDDAVCLVVYTLAIALVNTLEGGSNIDITSTVVYPLLYNLAAVVIGLGLGYVHAKLLNNKRSVDNRLILTVAVLLIICGICSLPFISISPLMCCMVFGASYVNFRKDQEVFNQMDGFTPPIMCLFFVLSGMKMDFTNFAVVGTLGIVYFLSRILGKYLGAYTGCKLAKENNSISVNLGLALIPQAGVAIGLADLGSRLLKGSAGSTFLSIILCSSVLYEIIGPGIAKLALIKSGAFSKERLASKGQPSVSMQNKSDLITNGLKTN